MNVARLIAAFVIVLFVLVAILSLDARLENIELRLNRTETQASLLNAAYQLEQKKGQ